MVTEHLTEQMQTEGRTLTNALDEAGLCIDSALWYYFEEANQWRYVFVSPMVEKSGPKEVYKRVLKIIHGLNGKLTTLGASNVVAVSSKQSLSEVLRKPFGIFSKEGEVRMSRRIEDRFIDDAYVYRTTNGKDATSV